MNPKLSCCGLFRGIGGDAELVLKGRVIIGVVLDCPLSKVVTSLVPAEGLVLELVPGVSGGTEDIPLEKAEGH